MSLVIGFLYYQLGHGQADANNRVALVFLSLMHSFFSSSSSIPVIVARRAIFFREKTGRMYSPNVYYLARIVADLPLILGQTTIYIPLIYGIAALRTDDNGIHFGQYYVGFFFAFLIGYALSELLVICFLVLSLQLQC